MKSENNNIEISVIMGVFNQKNRDILVQAVDSILSQTYEDFEFLIYDDGSCKEEALFLKSLEKKDQRIKVFREEENNGLAYALNQCIRRAQGKYIARMDADDLSKPERLRNQKEFLDKNTGVAFVGLSAELFDETGVWGYRKMEEKPREKEFLRFSPFIHPSVMFRKEVLLNANGYNSSKDTLRCEDYELFMRLYCMGYQGYNMNGNFFSYRENREWYDKRNIKQRIAEMKIRYRGFKKMGILKFNTFVYVIKPVIMLFVPKRARMYIRNRNINYTE